MFECVAGCIRFDGGERKHHRDCPHYPESLTKCWHDTEAEYVAEIERLRSALQEIGNLTETECGTAPLIAMRAILNANT